MIAFSLIGDSLFDLGFSTGTEAGLRICLGACYSILTGVRLSLSIFRGVLLIDDLVALTSTDGSDFEIAETLASDFLMF
jgi:hypothetical protein